MKPTVKKILFIAVGVAIVLLILIVGLVSPVAKHFIEKYDEKYTGRQINIDWLYINPITAYAYINDIKIYEANSDSIFFSANGIRVDFALFKMLKGIYQISDLTIDHPYINIVQNGQQFNFDDLMEKFKTEEDTTEEETKFNVHNIKIRDGEFYYSEDSIPVNYFIKNFDFESAGISWNVDTVPGKFSFEAGPGSGNMEGDFVFNLDSLSYKANALIRQFDLTIVNEYLKEIAYGEVKGLVDADIQARGKVSDSLDLTAKGKVMLSDFHFAMEERKDFTSVEKVLITIDEISTADKKYFIDSVIITHPYFNYEQYDRLSNIETAFGKKGEKYQEAKKDTAQFNLVLMVADNIRLLGEAVFGSDYKVNTFALENGEIYYHDFSLREKFFIGLNPLNIKADSINRNNQLAHFTLQSGIKPYGKASVILNLNPKDFYDFDFSYRIHDLAASMFNPYMVTYSSFPIDRGTIEFLGKWNVDDGLIRSTNHLIVVDPRTGKRIRKKDAKWLPVPLVLAFVRERGNVIDYEIPIQGNLKDPNFRVGDVITDVLKNIFIKPPSTPYRLEVKNAEEEIEKSLAVKWEKSQVVLSGNQEDFVQKISKFMDKNPEAGITVEPKFYAEKEKEYILLFEAKKKYFQSVNRKKIFSEDDSVVVDNISSKDSSFTHWLNQSVKDSTLYSMQDKCMFLVGHDRVDTKYQQLLNLRKQGFLSYFGKSKERIRFSDHENIIPYNGYSYYQLVYSGDIPDDLWKAYQEYEELNEENFRKRYEELRRSAAELYSEAIR